jgi:hypothetical protein
VVESSSDLTMAANPEFTKIQIAYTDGGGPGYVQVGAWMLAMLSWQGGREHIRQIDATFSALVANGVPAERLGGSRMRFAPLPTPTHALIDVGVPNYEFEYSIPLSPEALSGLQTFVQQPAEQHGVVMFDSDDQAAMIEEFRNIHSGTPFESTVPHYVVPLVDPSVADLAQILGIRSVR